MRRIVIILFVLTATYVSAQKYHRIGYVDTDYILKSVPSYMQAQNTLDTKVGIWKTKLETLKNSIQTLRVNLSNEKPILTKELIEEREEDIKIKENELQNMKNFYFGSNGEMYNLRRKLVQPIQDMIFNAVQKIASKKKLDFVFDKSNSGFVMLYARKKHNISKLVLKLIKIDLKKQTVEQKQKAKTKLFKEAAKPDYKKKTAAQVKAEKQKKLDAERRKKLLEKRNKLKNSNNK